VTKQSSPRQLDHLVVDALLVNETLGGGLTFLKGMLGGILNHAPDLKIELIASEKNFSLTGIAETDQFRRYDPGFDPTSPAKRYLNQKRLNQKLVEDFAGLNPVMWFPFNVGISRKLAGIRTALTIHDFLPFDCPECVSLIRRTMKKLNVRNSIRNADGITTISHFTTHQMYLKFPELLKHKPVQMIWEGYTEFGTVDDATPDLLRELPGYCLFVGINRIQKNLPFLCRAFGEFVRQAGYEGQLVIVGKYNDESQAELRRELAAMGLADRIVFTGFVPDAELPHYYRNCDLFLFASYYEGFGLPIVEAAYYGAKVVSSDAASLAEVGKDFAYFCSPFDEQGFARTMQRALHDPQTPRLPENTFCWDQAGKKLIDFLSAL
jgi:glycosyltransferase involved in cell wall biosynthesis